MNVHKTQFSDSRVQPVDIKSIISLVEADMTLVNETIANNLNSNVALINQLGAYIVQAGGKRQYLCSQVHQRWRHCVDENVSRRPGRRRPWTRRGDR